MSYLVFRNKGMIDPRSITTFGVSSKENSSAIGYFGTGLKYAIAILLREGCLVTVYSGTKKLVFGTKRDKIRVNEFDTVTMNGKRLGFTTELGKTWKVWQAFRELYCNTMDENGTVEEDGGVAIIPKGGETTIIVEGSAILEAWYERESVILQTTPLVVSGAGELHRGKNKYLFYRGIRAHEDSKPFLFTWNILEHMTLTEDRTISYSWNIPSALRRILKNSTDVELIASVLCAHNDYYESGLDWNGCEPGPVFLEVATKLVKEFATNLNTTVLPMVRGLNIGGLIEADSMGLTNIQTQQLSKALYFCASLGYPVDDYPIIVTNFLGEGVLGQAYDGKIYISSRAFTAGTKTVAGTLIEEYLHLAYKFKDCTRDFQNYLIDTIISMGEIAKGEPL